MYKIQEAHLVHGSPALVGVDGLGAQQACMVGNHGFLAVAERRGGPLTTIDLSMRWFADDPDFSSTDTYVWDRLYPKVEVLRARTQEEYQHLVNLALASSRPTAVYWIREHEVITPRHVQEAFTWLNSPLTDELKLVYGHEVIAKAILHLHDLMQGEARSLVSPQKNEAWARVAERQGNAVFQVVSRGGL